MGVSLDVAKQQKKDLRGVTRDLEKDQRYIESEEKKLVPNHDCISQISNTCCIRKVK